MASLPFALPPVIPASPLLEDIGGNIEPFVFIVLFWVLLAGLVAPIPCSTYPSDFVPGFGFGSGHAEMARGRNLVGIARADSTFGHSLAPVLLSGECLAALLGIWKGRQEGQDRRGSSPAFLVVTGAAAMLTYVAIGRGSGCLSYLRYVLLALLLPVGPVAGAFVPRPSRQRVAAASSPTSISGPE